jgi:CheY-like chemotaxis protein
MTDLRILYVDDEDDIREVAAMALGLASNVDVRTSASGQQAIEDASEWKPDLILLDVMMPQMDGPNTLEVLRQMEATKDIPVVFVTARTQPYEVERFLELGAAGLIAKPFDPMTLAQEALAFLNTH